MTELVVDWCSYKAAKYAVEHWHYSKSMPTPPRIMIGVWEDKQFIGVVIFSRGSNNNMLKPFGLDVTQGCELTRVALASHIAPVSQVVGRSLKLLRRRSPGVRIVVSYADPNHCHVGAIYQAGNWLYTGATADDYKAIDKTGRAWHSRQVSRTGVKRQYGMLRSVPKLEDCEIVPLLGKHRYLYPLDRAMRRQILPLAQPYPKRETCGRSVNGDTADTNPQMPGSIPGVRSMTKITEGV